MLLCKGFLSDNLIFNQHKFSILKLYYFAWSVTIIVTICAKLAYTNFYFFKGKLEGTLPRWPETQSGLVSVTTLPTNVYSIILHEIKENKNLIEQ